MRYPLAPYVIERFELRLDFESAGTNLLDSIRLPARLWQSITRQPDAAQQILVARIGSK